MTRLVAFVACLSVLLFDCGTAAASPGPPQVVYVTPGLGAGAGRTFTFAFTDPDGASDVATTEGLIVTGTEINGVNACYFFASGSQFWLRDDAHTRWVGPVTAGSSGVLSNSQCALSASGSSTSSSGDRVTMTVTLTFAVAFAGPKTVHMNATDRSGLASDWIRAGSWTVSPLNPQPVVLTSLCTDPSRDSDIGLQIIYEPRARESRWVYTPSCFPGYSFLHEGMFINERTPLPMMGRTCGQFNLLIAFTNTGHNRQELLDNTSIPASVKGKIAAGRVQEGLEELFASYTSAGIMSGLRTAAAGAVGFTFTVAVTSVPRHDMEFGNDEGMGFARYDAVVILDDLITAAGLGVRRWPWNGALFDGRDRGFFLNIDPFWITPGLLGNELLRRNMPVALSEYEIGQQVLVREGNTTFDRTPVVNPRTGENIEPLMRAYEGKISVGVYLSGWADVDADGVVDCVDPAITPTADNVDGDRIPDRFDPDLGFKHQPYSWMYAARIDR